MTSLVGPDQQPPSGAQLGAQLDQALDGEAEAWRLNCGEQRPTPFERGAAVVPVAHGYE